MNIEVQNFLDYFTDIKDYRNQVRIMYKLNEIFLLILCAVLCGCDDFVEIVEFGKQRLDFLRKFLPYKNGIMSHDTLNSVFNKLDPEQFNKCFIQWASDLEANLSSQEFEIIAIDGKTLRGSHDRINGKSPIHVVSAWMSSKNITLGQLKVEGKSNEITAIPELLDLIDTKSKIITIDAMGAQKKIVEKIVEKSSDYILTIKDNQKNLKNEMSRFFDYHGKKNFKTNGYEFQEFTEIDKGHGRIEIRKYVMTDKVSWMHESDRWKNFRSIGMVESTRIIGGKETKEIRYYISSLLCDINKFSQGVRSHWGIENKCHWVLDVCMNEDRLRLHKEHGPENMSLVRKIALNLLKACPTKSSIKVKRKRAGWNNDYLINLLTLTKSIS